MVDICVLGTAATMPGKERALSAAYLSCGGRAVLFDCGEGTQTQMKRCGTSPMKTDLIALTHYHGDHIFGLPGLLQTMSCAERTEPLYIAGPAGLDEILKPIIQLAGKQQYEIIPIEIPEEGILLSTLNPAWNERAKISAFETCHRVKSQGYRFELSRAGRFMPEKAEALGIPKRLWGKLQKGESAEGFTPENVLGEERKGLSLVFSGDTAVCESYLRAAENADLLIADATYGDDADEGEAEKYGHCTYRQAAELAAKADVQQLILTHFSQKMKEPESFLKNASAFKNTVCAHDGMTIKLVFKE